KSVTFSAPAVNAEGNGELVGLRMSLQPGYGRLLVNVREVAFRESIDAALRKAVIASEKYSGVRLSNYDIVLDVDSQGFSELSGESAGAYFAAALIAMQSNRGLNPDASMSAAISENGTLLPVGGIDEKIIAAKAGSRKVFVISDSQEAKFEDSLSSGIEIRRAKDLSAALPYLLS
ncbi:MAG: S16 family serine protease, partial [Candidatus Micrarchaeota archaeon]